MNPAKEVSSFHIGVMGTMDATETAEKIKKGEITSFEAVECAVDRAIATHGKLNAVVNQQYEKAKKLAKNPQPGIFSGVPTFIKDLNDVEGLPTLCGSTAIKPTPAKKDDEIVMQFNSTGCIILGKSATSEYGLLPCGETLQNGDSHNPWNTGHSTGGSSAGAAALVAAGVVPFAHASDGGGSIRIPASCCGVIGLKPSRGRNTTSPTAKYVPINIAEDGVVTRSVRDTANYFFALEQYYKNPRLKPVGKVTGPGTHKLRIGVFTEASTGVESQDSVRNTVMTAGMLCEGLGHKVSNIKNPFRHETSRDFILYWSFLSFAIFFSELAAKGVRFNPFKASKFTKELASAFPFLSISAGASFRRLKEFENYYNSLFNDYDVLVSPTLSHAAPKLGHFGPHEKTTDILMRLNGYTNFTPTQNITGAPAISLPMGFSNDGLPIGVQFAADTGNERRLIELAFEIEEAEGLIKQF